jgi:hypothetical protein
MQDTRIEHLHLGLVEDSTISVLTLLEMQMSGRIFLTKTNLTENGTLSTLATSSMVQMAKLSRPLSLKRK